MKTTYLDSDHRSEDPNERRDIIFKARADAISHIGLNNKTSIKVSGWLNRKGYPDSVVKTVIKELTEEGTINDESYAMAVLKSRTRTKIESSRASLARLKRLGVPDDIAQRCVKLNFDVPGKESNDAITLLHLKFSKKIDTMHEWNNEQKKKFQLKCYRFLISRGYSVEKAYLATKALLKEEYIDEQYRDV